MTVFISIPWFHPAYKAGGPIQSIANMVEQFSENISYKIFCSNTDLDGKVLNVPANVWTPYNKNTEVYYASKNKLSISLIKREIRNSRADILFVNGIYSWYFNLMPLLFGKVDRRIISVRGMLHPGALSQKKNKKKLYITFWKLLSLPRKCDFHASAHQEKQFIKNIFGNKLTIFVAQNFPRVLNSQPACEKVPGFLNLISIALISPMKNHLLVLKALKLCAGQIAYHIYGPVKDNIYWKECLKEISSLPVNIATIYHGDIEPAKVEKEISKSHVFIMPSKSENFGHAFFEALSAGKPVITSHNTPWNNLKESKAGINTSVDDIRELKNAVDFFTAMDNAEYTHWSMAAKEYSTNAINIDDIKEQYHQMLFI